MTAYLESDRRLPRVEVREGPTNPRDYYFIKDPVWNTKEVLEAFELNGNEQAKAEL